MTDLFNLKPVPRSVKPWKPAPLDHEQWPPDYVAVYAWRLKQAEVLSRDPSLLESARSYYKTRPAEFIMHWMDTYNPRKVDNKWMPFVFFKRQYEFVEFLHQLRQESTSGLVEKCRDAGATWIACGYSVWSWLFIQNDAIGWGSRKQDLVDKLGDADSIFEKMRLIISRLPKFWLPKNFSPRNHATFMKLINPENGSTIAGEAGDNIGRGGRKSIYFKDEAQPLTAKIITPFGIQTMGEMQVGSIINGPEGWVVVTAINDCGLHPTYKVTLTDGSTTECSENHLWTVVQNHTKKQITKPLSEIIKNYKYHSPGGQTQYLYNVPVAKTVIFDELEGDHPLHPYLVGALLGDGSIGDVPNYSPKITTMDQEIVESFINLMPDGWTITQEHDRITYRLGDERGRMGWKYPSRARLGVVAAGIAGMKSENKRVPERYKFASVADRWAVLQGLMDTDGSVANGGFPTFHTSSPGLAQDVIDLVRSLGGVASSAVKADHRGFKDQHIVYIRINEPTRLFRLIRKINAVATRKQKIGRNILNIEYIGEKPVRCITVDSEDGLYLTDDFIVTHNSAHYERPEKIEAALGDNTNVQVDISSVNGLGNVFHRRREAGVEWQSGKPMERGKTQVFIIDWRHHPEKTEDWYHERRIKFESEGMQHVFAQEVDRNYSAAVLNTIINGEWIQAAIDAHLKIPALRVPPPDVWGAGLDVADEGMDRNALTIRQWVIVRHCEEWGERDAGVTTRRAIRACRGHSGIKVQYDSIGVGATVKAEYNRLIDTGDLAPGEMPFIPWNAGAGVVWPYERIVPGDDQSALNRDFFYNMKAQAWWALRTRFYKTWRALTDGTPYDPEDLISLDSSMPLLHQLVKELAQPTKGDSSGLRMIVNKTPEGTKSPNLADSLVMAMFPVPDDGGVAAVGGYSGA